MKILSISAKNFRTLQDFNLTFGPAYCAVSGKNNVGKTAVVKIIRFFFSEASEIPYFASNRNSVQFSRDATQWSQEEEMSVSVVVHLDRQDDSEVFYVVENFTTDKKIEDSHVDVSIKYTCKKDGSFTVSGMVGDVGIEERAANEVLKKFRNASNLVVHNSTAPHSSYFYVGDYFTEVLEAQFSIEEQKKISLAEKGLQTRVKKAARQHKAELEGLLGKLKDKYQVELSYIDRGRSSRFPLEVKLLDKSVEVPLGDWGSGTQNRTRILISVLDAIRMRSSVTPSDRSTPVFLVEEPESFLHPSAQAEFGQILNGLAEELKIQIIATTHSPYMLNQSDPSANILLERRTSRGNLRETYIIDTSGDDWMRPFAENLGIIPAEFVSWRSVFGANSGKVILVEGDIDREYFEIFKKKYGKIYQIPEDVEVLSYGGKDALKNTSILQFMINKFGCVFITFDLDSANEVKPALARIGLEEGKNFCAIGLPEDGMTCIEGLVPGKIRQQVYFECHEIVTAMSSANSAARNSARNKLKRAMLTKFKESEFDVSELSKFQELFSKISKAIS